LLDERVAFLFVQVRALDALPLKARLRLVQAEVHKEAVFHGLLGLVSGVTGRSCVKSAVTCKSSGAWAEVLKTIGRASASNRPAKQNVSNRRAPPEGFLACP
jgi:hypothetical protein